MLTNYRNSLFATRSTLNEALVQANDLYGNAVSTADSIAMRTAVHVVLNTAIQQHTIELAAIQDKHAAEVQALRSQLAARPDPVTALLALVDERVDNFLTHNLPDRLDNTFADRFDDAISSWTADKLDDKIEYWYDENVDFESAVKGALEDDIDIKNMVRGEVRDFFGNNTFSIEPR